MMQAIDERYYRPHQVGTAGNGDMIVKYGNKQINTKAIPRKATPDPSEIFEAKEDKVCPWCSGLIDVGEFGGRCMSDCGFSW